MVEDDRRLSICRAFVSIDRASVSIIIVAIITTGLVNPRQASGVDGRPLERDEHDDDGRVDGLGESDRRSLALEGRGCASYDRE